MPRFYKRKTNRERNTPEQIQAAVSLVLTRRLSIRSVAKDTGISKTALQKHVSIAKLNPDQEYRVNKNICNKQVFSNEQECMLRNYIKISSKMQYGLTKVGVRKRAYEYAKKLNIKYPETWNERKIAGKEWLVGFMHRSKDLSLRTPESTSLSRATSFNKHNVSQFFENLKGIMERKEFPPHNIYNLDETGLTTVQKPPKILAPKGQKQVGQVTSAERGQLVTMCNIINAVGNTMPPVYIFPRVKFANHMLHGAPPGSLGLAHKSGWMTAEIFLQVMHHFIKHSKASNIDNPVLLILDNHESHITIDVIDLARENGVHILTFPPHCSHRLQPLDVAVYGPFKARYNVALNNWMINNPGKVITIYEIAQLSAEAFNLAMKKENILSGFSKTGIQPFNSQIFSEDDFLMSSVTDRPLQQSAIDEPILNNNNLPSSTTKTDDDNENKEPDLTTSEASSCSLSARLNESSPKPSTSSEGLLRPEDFFPFPKAPQRVSKKGGRAKGKTRILTDTPEKNEIILQKTPNKNKTQIQKVTKKLKIASSSSSDSDDVPDKIVKDSSSDMDEEFSDAECIDEYQNTSPSQAVVDSFILCKFVTNKNCVYYVGKITDINNCKYTVNFLRRRRTSFVFVYPEIEDKYEVQFSDIILTLPNPRINKGTARMARTYTFPINLEEFNQTLR